MGGRLGAHGGNTHPRCTSCEENFVLLAHWDLYKRDGSQNDEPLCIECIEKDFILARDNEEHYPIMFDDEIQLPSMNTYSGWFTQDFIADWNAKVFQWYVFVENRIHCTCKDPQGRHPFVSNIDPAETEKSVQCKNCDKIWCKHCGDEYGTAFGDFNQHNQPGHCVDRRSEKQTEREDEFLGTRGQDYQLCPRCHRESYSSFSDKATCDGCATVFCMTCGLKRAEAKWPVGETCDPSDGHLD